MEQEQLSLFDLAAEDRQPNVKRKHIDLFTMQQANKYRQMNAELFCTCSDSPRAQITAIRYSQGTFQVKIAGAGYWLTPSRVWAESEAV